MDRLSALSAAFLTAEDVDPEVSMVIGSCAVLAGPRRRWTSSAAW